MRTYRKQRKIPLCLMARKCQVSQKLLEMLEMDDHCVTHPLLAGRVGVQYELTEAQVEGLLPEHYRRSSPEYNPDKYKHLFDEPVYGG